MELKQNSNKDVYVLGELIHNAHVINELTKMGIKTVPTLPQNGCGYCVIRSHGVAPEIIEDIENNGYEILDMTCPDVKKVQQRAVELAKSGYFVVIVGKSHHPEVVAIKANAALYSDDIVVAASLEELMPYEDRIKSHQKVGIVVQTTQMLSTLNTIVNRVNSIAKEVLIYNTICKSTSMRQKEARELARESDLMVVVGSKKSANTTHLAEILKTITETIHIENESELEQYRHIFKTAQNIAITAGASTPQNVINKVIEHIEKEN